MDVFISYSRHDHAWKERVALFMQCMRRQNHFDYTTWDDGEIKVSEEWQRLVETSIDSAKVAILLISPDFLASRFINEVELPRILGRRDTEGLYVVPVIVRPSPWEVVDWLASIQMHPSGGKALSAGTEHEIEEHLKQLTLEIHRLVAQTRDNEELPDHAAAPPSAPAPSAEAAVSRYEFLSEADLEALVKREVGEPVIELLLLYKIKTQRVWLAATPTRLVCIIDSLRTANSRSRVQWSQPLSPGMRVFARPKSRLPTAGLLDVGNRQNWLYSLSLYPDAAKLREKVETMIERGLRS